MEKQLNVFEGQDAVKKFLDPGQNVYLPLVELPATINPFAKDNVRIYAKLMNMMPLGNVKAAPAFNMIKDKYLRGEMAGMNKIVENSSGNTVSSIALVARHFGINDVQSYVPAEISWHKLMMLLFFGVEPIVNVEPQNPDASDPDSGVSKAKKDAMQDGVFNPGQYDNDANPKAHEKWTAPQIWEQTAGKIDIFCAGLGTTGTIIGNSRYLKDKKPALRVVGAMRAPDNYVPGVRTEKLLKLVGFNWRKHVDKIEPVETALSYRLSLEMSRGGIIVGPSSGLALAGLLQYLESLKATNRLDDIRNKKTGEIVCVFPCPDGPLPYIDEYFKYVDRAEFPSIQNEELLLNKPHG
ncbi:MAG: pyridoxal-phosphate dependent enzyme [Proteobacteria bacterium]|nr:pyridoxal-phosphate dependent enzyme [Pseudomonadota bacterium]